MRSLFLGELEEKELETLRCDWPVWARLKQRPPFSDWRTWLVLGGRGAGKTRTGAEWLRGIALGDPHYAGDSAGRPEFHLLDIPSLRDADVDRSRVLVAVNASPWAREYSLFASMSQNGFQPRHETRNRAITGSLLVPLGSGPTGRLDYGNELEIVLNWGELESRSLVTVLNGRNVLAVQSANHEYEILQFLTADFLGENKWRLTGLLRGLAGTQDETQAGALSGAAAVLLDQGISDLDLEDSETGSTLNWRVGPSRYDYADDTFASRAVTYSGKTRRMLKPVHLRRSRVDDRSVFTWIRCGRINADNWDNPEIPLDADEERYRVRIRTMDGATIRETIVDKPEFEYTNANMRSDFGPGGVNGKLEVMQLNNSGNPGAVAAIRLKPKGEKNDS